MKMNGRVKGKVALVTGGALGIGRACAKMLAQEGAAVIIADVLTREGQALKQEICEEGGTVHYLHMDVSDEKSVRSAFETAKAKFGNVTVLVNNAGISGVNKPTHEITEGEWDHLMAVNVKGVFFCTKHAIPQMLAAGGGSIVNLSSIYGLVGNADVPPYHASKGAVRLMSKNDALIYAPQRIRVNSVHPAFIWTPMVDNFINSQSDPVAARAAIEASHPLGHMGDVDDIAYGVLYLASDEAKFITGSELVIDGGYTAR
jgi:NAD(P)-dependent dehydrogenase (short-subunit alcohol dehydrogenase family)